MEQICIELLPAQISPTSSLKQLCADLLQAGVLPYPMDRLKDNVFSDYVLPVTLKSMEDVYQFLGQLDTAARRLPGAPKSTCEKADAARYWMHLTHHPDIPELKWALRGLASARGVHCACHEKSSFYKTHS